MATEDVQHRLGVKRLVFGLACLAAVSTAVATAAAATGPRPPLGHLVAAIAVVTVAVLLVVPLGIGGRSVSIDLVDCALALTLALLPPAWSVLLIALARSAQQVAARRPALKSIANISTAVIPASAAALLVAGCGVSGWPAAPGQWPVLILAAPLYSILSGSLTGFVIACAMGDQPTLRIPRTAVIMASGHALLVFITLLEWRYARDLAVATPLLLAGSLYLSHRAAAHVDEDSALARLAEACEPAHNLDPTVALTELADRAVRLFGAKTVEIDLLGWPTDGGRLLFTRAAAGETTLRPRPNPTDSDEQWWLSAPLIMAGELLGELRLSEVTTRDARRADRQVMAAFQATVAGYIGHTRGRLTEAQAARQDPLTGLANRLGLTEAGSEMLASTAAQALDPHREPDLVGFLLLDLDHFKEVNDTLGHAAGDLLLVEVGRRLRSSCRTHDVVGRLGGDEFAVVLNGLRSPAEADRIAEAMLKRLTAPLLIDGLNVPVEGSIGVATSRDGDTLDELRRCSDIAMYAAKSSGRGAVAHYSPSLDTSSPERLELIAELQAGIVSQELAVHYQPKVELATGRIIGAEALVRWQHPTRGLLMPGVFVPAVERSALIIELTMAVLRAAIAEAQVWAATILPRGVEPSIAVNISRRCLIHREFPQEVALLLATAGVRSDSLILEVTEATELAELDVVEDVLSELRRLGVRLSVDDFGTGYSSMSFFQRVQVNEVKVEGQFVRAMDTDRASDAIVRSTVALGHGVGLPVVAEGIETQEQLEAVTAAGADIGQGYHLGRPVPATVFRAALSESWAVDPVAG